MTAKAYLRQYREAVAELKCKEQEREMLYERATNVSPSMNGGTPNAGEISDKTGRGAVSIVELDEVISAEIQNLKQLLTEIRSTISKVQDANERNLLTYYYICGFTWEQTAVQMSYSYVHVVKNLHPAALKSISAIIGENA